MKRRKLISYILLFAHRHPDAVAFAYVSGWLLFLYLAWNVYGVILAGIMGWDELMGRMTCAFFVILTSYAVEFIKPQ